MKKLILLMAIVGVLIYVVSCSKTNSGYYSCDNVAPAQDTPYLSSYAKYNGITPTVDTSLLYYQIIDSGSGPVPIPKSKITVNYIGKFLNGTVFDTTSSGPATYELDSLIKGWQYGLPKIQQGGRIKLLVPSSLAFGCLGSGSTIPPNTPLYFDISLVKVSY